VVGIAAAVLVAGSAASCGKSSPSRVPQPDAAATRLADVCRNATHELMDIDQHSLGIDPYLAGSVIEHAAGKAEVVDKSTSASVRRLPNTPNTAATLKNLAHSASLLRRIVGEVHRHNDGYSSGLLLKFLRANSGCGTVRLASPTSISTG
jgi:hypothetical protein